MNLPAFKLERYFAQYEFHVEFTLCSSDSEAISVGALLDLEPDAREKLEQLWLGYTVSQGAPSLCQEIAQIYDTIQPENVLVHTGAEEAIFLFMHAVLKAGDHILVHAPFYQSLGEVASSIGCEVTRWEAQEENGWALDVHDLRGMIRPTTRAIIINTPHNPTGYLMSRADYLAVNAVARERGIILFSDEVYREAEYDIAARLPASCDVNDTAVSLGVMSKTFGLPGLRIGWIATHNAEILERMAALKDYTTICNSAPSEFMAELALRHRARLARRNLDLVTRNLGLLETFFAQNADRFAWVRPQAGPIAFPKLLGGDVDTFCHDVVTQAGVLLLPGTLFDDTGNHFRIGFGRANMPQALSRLEQFLAR